MKSILKQSLKLLAMCMAVAVIFTLSQRAAQAQELTVAGSTIGSSFDTGSTSLGGLNFNGTTFGGTTSNGELLLDQQNNNLGSLTFSQSDGQDSGTFSLRVLFRLPSGLSANPVTVTGDVFGSGSYFRDPNNFAIIDFPNNSFPVTFSGANGTGVFSLVLHDVCLSGGIPCDFGEIGKLRRHKSPNALAFNTAKSGDGNVKFVKAKASSSMFAQDETFTITATITLTQFTPANVGQCKNGGWQDFVNPSFKNQGECVSSFNHAAKEDK